MSASGYDLAAPTKKSLIAALTANLGSDAANSLVELAARQIGRREPTSLDELIRMTEYLMELGDLARVTARSEKVRALTFRALHAPVE